jgi:DNA end-binding protein Ku
MSRRSVASANIAFGLVIIPVKFYTSASENSFSFNQLSPKTKNKLKQKLYDPETGDEFSQRDVLKGYEFAKDKYIAFSQEEIDAQISINKESVNIQDFVSKEAINPFQIEKYYFISPNKGADKSYKLIAKALSKVNKVAIGTWAIRNKEHLVMIMPFEDGLVLAQLWYSDEVRAFEAACANYEFEESEIDLAVELINQLTKKDFDISKYYNKFNKNMHALVEQKVSGGAISTSVAPVKSDVTDLFAQLKASLKVKEPVKKISRKKAVKKAASK